MTPANPSPGDEWLGPDSEPEFVISRSAIIMIGIEPYKHNGLLPGRRIYLMHMKTGMPYLRKDERGEVGLLTKQGWDDMTIDGELRVVEPPPLISARLIARMTDWDYRAILGNRDAEGNPAPPVAGEALPLEPGAAKMLAQVLCCDEHGAKSGNLSIRRTLEKHWPGELEEKFGAFDSPPTIRRWRSERGTPGDRRLTDFVRMWGRVPRGGYSDGLIDGIIYKVCLRVKTEPGTIEEIAAEVATLVHEINAGKHPDHEKPTVPYPIPSQSKVYRSWRELENAYTAATMEGAAVMRSEWKGSGRSLKAKHPLQLAMIDHTRLPMSVVIDLDNDIVFNEIWLTVLVDVYSRAVLGWVITAFPPSLWTVAEVIRRANRQKRPPPGMAKKHPILRRLCGRSDIIIVDNGREFRGHGLEDAVAGAGFSIRFAPIKRPTYKAVIERLFRTIKGKLTSRLPGVTIPIARASKREYDARIKACVILEDLEALMNQCMAEYHTEPHEGLLGRQPALVFQKGTGGHIEICHEIDRFMNEIMEVRFNVQVDKAGVTRWGLRYTSPPDDPGAVSDLLDDLVPIEPRRQRRDDASARTKLKFDRMNIGRILVWNGKTRRYVLLVCEYSNYSEGMPLELHKQIRDQAKAEADEFNSEEQWLAERARRIRAIRSIDVTASREQKAELAKLNEIPRIHQLVGNILDLSIEPAEAVTLDDFIHHDVAAIRSIDDEVRAPRKDVASEGSDKPQRIPARDRRRGGQPPRGQSQTEATSPRRSGSSRKTIGEY
ncbi:DDE-type integrase/transposase/recombinase [Sphingomonas sp. CFBP 8760]|uniref:DDE-type integrase/transposase/recombinase n=1 Tax=Sphingomonas sp. CFBP 8760 TaxID=2775282 RepID=UPI001781770D|nr:DDE-type integrase/transposase/recombinase [Sphingomonas sp. CFBP 8760]MBD8548838.1 DDE-type integrase/transposase/recombinase [Sphingomonas sp. CFBP 8760]